MQNLNLAVRHKFNGRVWWPLASGQSGPFIWARNWCVRMALGRLSDLIFAYQCERCLRLHHAACTLRRQEGVQLCGSRFARAAGVARFGSQDARAECRPGTHDSLKLSARPLARSNRCMHTHARRWRRRARRGGLKLSPTPERCAEPTRHAPCECSVRTYINYLNNARG